VFCNATNPCEVTCPPGAPALACSNGALACGSC
jgi:hypothetical protein